MSYVYPQRRVSDGMQRKRLSEGRRVSDGQPRRRISDDGLKSRNRRIASNRSKTTGSINNDSHDQSSNIKVYVRCRSRNQREIDEKSSVVISTMGPKGKEVIFSTSSSSVISSSSLSSNGSSPSNLLSSASKKTYTFDQVFGAESDQDVVFNVAAKDYIQEMLQGYNCTIFAYGQTGTGKTYTMSGDISIMGDVKSQDKLLLSEHAGIIPRVLVDLFQELTKQSAEYSVKISFLELYNEKLKDLLPQDSNNDGESIRIFDNNNSNGNNATNNISNNNTSSKINNTSFSNNNTNNKSSSPNNNITIVTNNNNNSNQPSIMVKGMDEIYIKSAYEGLQLLTEGSLKRKVASTKCNDLSSRSHTIFTITTNITKINPATGEQYVKVGKLNLVDLAGSENISRSGAENKRAQEAGLINKSLLTLGRVINSLVDRSQHIPYRESKLTRLLQDSLGGKTKTCIIATISPAKISMEETISTLEYATRAKSIKNTPQINQTLSKDVSLNSYVNEIERLRHELKASRQKDGIFITQDQFESYESNVILINEQKIKIHNMEEQIQRFKDKYVTQLDITKDLETRFKNLEADNIVLQNDKDNLINLINEYLKKSESFSSQVLKIHNNNIKLVHDLEEERDDLFEKTIENTNKKQIISKELMDHSDSLINFKNLLNDYGTRFKDVISGIYNEFEEKTVAFQNSSNNIIKNIDLETVLKEVTDLQISIEPYLKSITESKTDLLNPLYQTHREIISQCLDNLVNSVNDMKSHLADVLSNISDTILSDTQKFDKTINHEFSQSNKNIDYHIKCLEKLEKELQKERELTFDLKNHIKDLEQYIKVEISEQRKNSFKNLYKILQQAENENIEMDNFVFKKVHSKISSFNNEQNTISKKIIKDITIKTIESLEGVQLSHNSTFNSLNSLTDERSKYIQKLINDVPISSVISKCLEQLKSNCNEDSSSILMDDIKKVDTTLSQTCDKVNLKIRQLISTVQNKTNHLTSENIQEVTKLSQNIKELSLYILNYHKENIKQISTTQSDILEEHFQGINQVCSTINNIATSLKDDKKVSIKVKTSENLMPCLPGLEKPSNFTIYEDLKKEAKVDELVVSIAPESDISPVRPNSLKYIPSTPVPIPDQPLPKVLIPKSINSTSKRTYNISSSVKKLEGDDASGNNLKRKFSLDPPDENFTSIARESDKKTHL